MANITCSVVPMSSVGPTDIEGPGGRIVGLCIDGVQIYLARYGDKDDVILAAANMLIGVLVGLRDAAEARIQVADLAAIDAESPAEGHEVVAEWTRGTA